MSNLIRYENVKQISYRWGPKTYEATAIYEGGISQHVTLSEVALKRYELEMKLKSYKVSQEVMDLLDDVLDLQYLEGQRSNDEFNIKLKRGIKHVPANYQL